jgi:hypothetical protein
VEALLLVAVFVLVPAGLLASVGPAARRILAVLGVVAALLLDFALSPFGPDDSRMLLAALPLCATLAAFLAELVLLPRALWRRRGRRRNPGDA